MVKRLRHRPFTAVTRVRFPSGSPKTKEVLLCSTSFVFEDLSLNLNPATAPPCSGKACAGSLGQEFTMAHAGVQISVRRSTSWLVRRRACEFSRSEIPVAFPHHGTFVPWQSMRRIAKGTDSHRRMQEFRFPSDYQSPQASLPLPKIYPFSSTISPKHIDNPSPVCYNIYLCALFPIT